MEKPDRELTTKELTIEALKEWEELLKDNPDHPKVAINPTHIVVSDEVIERLSKRNLLSTVFSVLAAVIRKGGRTVAGITGSAEDETIWQGKGLSVKAVHGLASGSVEGLSEDGPGRNAAILPPSAPEALDRQGRRHLESEQGEGIRFRRPHAGPGSTRPGDQAPGDDLGHSSGLARAGHNLRQ